MKIGILNAYDARNRGDLAIILCQIAWLKKVFPEAAFYVFSHHFQSNAAAFGEGSTESLIHLPRTGGLRKMVNPVGDWIRFRSGARRGKFKIFRECDLYVLSGGGYLYSSRSKLASRNLICICAEFQQALRTRKPVFPFPQSFGPLNKSLDNYFVHAVAKRLSVLTPRCPESIRLLSRWGFDDKIIPIPDVCLGLRKLLPNFFINETSRQGMGIAPIDWSFVGGCTPSDLEDYLNKMVEISRFFFQKTGEPIMLLTQVAVPPNDDDSMIVQRLQEKISRVNIPVSIPSKDMPFSEYLCLFQRLRLCIGSRMHSCIFALVSHTPVLGLAYQPKFQGVFETLTLNDWFQPIDQWQIGWATARIEEALSNPNLSKEIEIRVKGVEQEMFLNLQRAMDRVLGRSLPSEVRD